MIKRRRFIQIIAAAGAGTSAIAQTDVQRWRGRAMGADVSLDLFGAAPRDLEDAQRLIHDLEARFSLYDPGSELSRLNAAGRGQTSDHMAALLQICDDIHNATGGLFEPTVQPVFAALAKGLTPPWDLIGWDRVTREAGRASLGPGQALTLNGIAQGYATDCLADLMRARGLERALVHVGEHAAIGGPFRLSLEDPVHGPLGHRTLQNGALATSSPSALRFGAQSHILHPLGFKPQWSTVSVEAQSAAVADAVSTALCLASKSQVQEIVVATQVRATLVDLSGDLTVVS